MHQATPALLDDAVELARILRPTWPARRARLRATGVPLNEGDDVGDGGDGATGDGASGGGSGDQGDAGGAGAGRGGEKPPWEANGEEFDPDRAWRLIQGLKGDLGKTKAGLEKANSKLREHDDAKLSDSEKLTQRAETAEASAASAEGEAARLRVVLKKGLTGDRALAIAKRLVGDDEAALEKDADELLADLPQRTDDDDGDGDGGKGLQRRPKERGRPGAARNATPDDDDDPAALASRVKRGW